MSNTSVSLYFLYAFLLSLVIVFCSLGTWQLQRADEKSQQAEEILNRADAPAINLNQSLEAADTYLSAKVSGRFLQAEEFLLDNIVYKGKPGYYVLTPFRLEDSSEVLLINRGWVAKTQALPTLPETLISETGLMTIAGTLALPRSKPAFLGSLESPLSDVKGLWFYMDKAFFAEKTGLNVLPLVLRLSPENPNGYVRDWPKYQVKTGMHIGYAIQWFVFALFVLIAWFGIIYKNKSRS